MRRRILRWLGMGLLISTAASLVWTLYEIVPLLKRPTLQSLLDYRPPETTFVFDENNEILGGFAQENRVVIPLEEMGEIVPKVFLTAEDRRFSSDPVPTRPCSFLRYLSEKVNLPVDWCSLYRAVRRDLKEKRLAEGASTISQQLAQIAILQRNPQELEKIGSSSWKKKFRKGVIAYYLEKEIPKNRILELYLNHIYLGNGNFGVEAASRWYWQKSTRDLTKNETALIAGLVRSPSHSPFNYPKKAEALRLRVLGQLLDEKVITPEEYEAFQKEPLPKNPPEESYRFPNSHLLEYIRRQIERDLGGEEIWIGGLHIYTTINKRVQDTAEAAVKERVLEYHLRHLDAPARLQGAVLLMEIETGDVKAWVNSTNFREEAMDLVYQAKRQPGSAFKIFDYLAMLKNGARLDCRDQISSGPCLTYDVRTVCIDMGAGRPKKCIENYPYKNKEVPRYHGRSELKINLWESRNAGTVRAVTVERITTVKEIIEVAEQLGIKSPLANFPSTILGSSEVSLYEITLATNAIANLGKKIEPRIITVVKDRYDGVIRRHQGRETENVLDEKLALQMIRGLRGVVEHLHGTGRGIMDGFICKKAAAKTGTATNNEGKATDNWLIAFTPSYIFGGWMGFTKEKLPLGDEETGGKNVVPIFNKVMNEVYKDGGCEEFPEVTNPFKPLAQGEQENVEILKEAPKNDGEKQEVDGY